MIWQLFIIFAMIGAVSFGGGYAIIPVIDHEVARLGWMSTQEFIDVIAVAGMSPGPIATNTAIFVGFKTMGLPGALAATFGIVLPSFLIVVLLSVFYNRLKDSQLIKAMFYGLRPVIAALILYSAYRFARFNQLIGPVSWHTIGLLFIFAGSLYALKFKRIHPLYIIVGSGLCGLLFYG